MFQMTRPPRKTTEIEAMNKDFDDLESRIGFYKYKGEVPDNPDGKQLLIAFAEHGFKVIIRKLDLCDCIEITALCETGCLMDVQGMGIQRMTARQIIVEVDKENAPRVSNSINNAFGIQFSHKIFFS